MRISKHPHKELYQETQEYPPPQNHSSSGFSLRLIMAGCMEVASPRL